MTTPAVSPDESQVESFRNGSRTDAMGSKPDTWTRWFDVDTPTSGYNNGDYETVYRIQRTFKICDKDYEIAAAECCINGDPQTTFTEQTPRNMVKDYLQRFCTTDGLVCTNEDQPEGTICQDYSVRFRCHYIGGKDNDGSYPQFDVRIYIILAVVPILIFLLRMLWTYVCRRRRQQRRNQRRARQRLNRDNGDDFDDDSSSVASGVANPPPSYQELFGKTGHATTGSSVFAISRDNIPICLQCQRNSCSVASIIGKQRSLQHSAAIGQFVPSDTAALPQQQLLNQPMESAVSRQQQTESTSELAQQDIESENPIENIDNSFTDVGAHVSNPSSFSAEAPISFSAPGEAHCSPSATAKGASSPSAPTEESEGASSSSAPTEGASSPSAPTDGASSPSAPTEGASSPSAPTEGASSPSAPKEGASSPSAPTEEASSPSAPTEGASSPSAPTEGASSPSAPTEGASSPSAPTEGASSPSAPIEGGSSPSALTERASSPSALTERASSPSALTERASSPSALTEGASLPLAITEESRSPSVTIENPGLHQALKETLNSPSSLSETHSSPSKLALSSSLTPKEEPSSPLASAEAHISSATPKETLNSPLASTEMPNFPLASTEASSSPLTSREMANSPLASTEMVISPLTTREIISSPLTPTGMPKSPLAPTKITNLPLAPTEVTNLPLAPTEITTSPLASTAMTNSPLTQAEMPYPHSTLTEASNSPSASVETPSPHPTSTEASNSPSTPTKTLNSSSFSSEAPFSPASPRASPPSEASQEIIIDITEANSANGSSSETTVLDLHTGNNQDQINPPDSISETLQASASQSSSLASSDLTLSLNPSLLNPGDISDPCACPCHRTIPLKHQGAAGYDNQGYAFDGDAEGNRHLSYPGMHIPAFGFHRVWSDLSVASSIAPADLPTYEVAVELINEKKTKVAESQTPSN